MTTTALGAVTVLGAHILDVLGLPVGAIPPGQGSVRLSEIRATAAGTAAGTGVDLAKLGASVVAIGALGDDLLGDMVVAAMARHGVDTSGLSRKRAAQTSATILPIRANGERPALHVPGATPLLELADVDLDRVRGSRALLIGAPDALGPIVEDGLPAVMNAAQQGGALVAVDVLHPGRPRDFERLTPLLASADWFAPNADQLLALTGRDDLAAAIKDVLALGTYGVAVTLGAAGCLVAIRDHAAPVYLPAIAVNVVDTTGCGDGFTAGLLAGLLLGATPVDAAWLGIACGSLVATGLGSDAGIENLGQVVDFLARTQAVAARIKETDQGADDVTDQELRERARAVIPGGMYGHQAAAPCRGISAVHARRPRGPGLGRGRERVRRPDVQLRAGGARPPASGRGSRRRRTGQTRRLPEWPRPGHGGAGRAAGPDGPPRGLGHVRQERHRRHHHVLHDRACADRPQQDPGGPRRLPRLRAVVHPPSGRRDARGARQPRLLHVQRPGQRARSRRSRWP